MGEKLIVGPVSKGLSKYYTEFNIDNDSFPLLQNAYQWRGRVKRKRGTSPLTRLRRWLGVTDGAGALNVTILPIPITEGITSFIIGSDILTDPGGASPVALISNNGLVTGTLNRATGALSIAGATPATNVFYYPTLPVMGLEDFTVLSTQFPGTIAFDTKYSYVINTSFPYSSYDVSYFKNPATGAYTNYVAKATGTPLWWNGQDYQQFWTTCYEGSMWTTNGMAVPFSITNIGMQFSPASDITVNAVTPTTIDLTIANCPLIIGDFVFFNEWSGTNAIDINFKTGYVTACAPNTPGLAAKTVTITFPEAVFASVVPGDYIPGIIQYLTTRKDTTLDCIRFYDGDPTNGSATAPAITGTKGWVNFCPPLSREVYSIANAPEAKYYLVGARIIAPFKDRILFLGPVIQAAGGQPIYLQDTVIFSQNGTPYYTASFPAGQDPSLATTVFTPLLVPVNQTATVNSFWEDQTGFGGFIQAGIDQAITTVGSNEDVLIVGFETAQTKLVYTNNDIVPFNFYFINSELGSNSTFSIVNMDLGCITRGSRGYLTTGQNKCERIDLDVPDQVFEIRLTDNGFERVCAQRDFLNEWIYFTYPGNTISYKFPNTTFFYNYREHTWAVFFECYTTYGQFKRRTGLTWATVGSVYSSWSAWNVPWNSGSSTLLQPEVIAGNQQGYVVVRDDSTDETESLTIQNISGNTVTSPNHCLNPGDFIVITGAQGTVDSQVNGNIFSVSSATTNTFVLNPSIDTPYTYLGGGQIKRMYIPYIQTKQFPMAWGLGRKTRIGAQQYLFTTTPFGQLTLLIFLSQDSAYAYNNSLIVPDPGSVNNSLIYSTVLYTCPESTNLGLTPANINLQTPTARNQEVIWHRKNTSLIGDTVQIGFTLNDEQMRDPDFNQQFQEFELHSFILDLTPSQLLV